MSHVFHNKAAVRALIRYGKAFCLIGIIIPLINLIIRIYSPTLLEKIIATGIVVINPLSAILFFLLGIALWLVRHEHTKGISRTVSICLVAVVLSVTALKAVSYIVNWNFSIDAFLFGDYAWIRYGEVSDSLWSQHFPYILISFILVSLSILFIDTTNSYLISYSQLLSYVMILLAMVNVYGYVFQIEILYGRSGEALPMSLLAAITSFFLSAAVLFLRPYKGSMRLLIGANPTKVILIRFFALLAPLILGWFETIGERRGYYSQEFGKAILTTFSFALTMALLGVKAEIQYTYRVHKKRVLHHIKQERKRLRRILKHSPTYINIVDVEKDRLVYSNVEKGKLLRGEKESASDNGFMKRLEKAANRDDREKLEKARQKIKTMGVNDYEEIEYRIIDSESKTRWLFSRRIVFKQTKGKVRQILMNTVDITKQKEQVEKVESQERKIERVNNELKTTRKELEKANETLKSKTDILTAGDLFYQAYMNESFLPIVRIVFRDIDNLDTIATKEYISDQILNHATISKANNSLLKVCSLNESGRLENVKLNQFWQAPETEKRKILYSFIENGFRLRAIRFKAGFSHHEFMDVSASITGVVKDKKLYGFWITINSG